MDQTQLTNSPFKYHIRGVYYTQFVAEGWRRRGGEADDRDGVTVVTAQLFTDTRLSNRIYTFLCHKDKS